MCHDDSSRSGQRRSSEGFLNRDRCYVLILIHRRDVDYHVLAIAVFYDDRRRCSTRLCVTDKAIRVRDDIGTEVWQAVQHRPRCRAA